MSINSRFVFFAEGAFLFGKMDLVTQEQFDFSSHKIKDFKSVT